MESRTREETMKTKWKLAAIGTALVMATSLGTGFATAYFAKPRAEAQTEVSPPRAVAPVKRVAYRPAPRATYQPAPTYQPPVQPAYTPAAVAYPAASPTTTSVGCESKDKWLRVGKDGLIGAVAGALLGAGGGAIADGKSGAGKGAAIGGIAGAATGAAYGLYQNKTACGSILN
jgi:hypothetical protein